MVEGFPQRLGGGAPGPATVEWSGRCRDPGGSCGLDGVVDMQRQQNKTQCSYVRFNGEVHGCRWGTSRGGGIPAAAHRSSPELARSMVAHVVIAGSPGAAEVWP